MIWALGVYLTIGLIWGVMLVYKDWKNGRDITLWDIILALAVCLVWIVLLPTILAEMDLDEIVILKGKKK